MEEPLFLDSVFQEKIWGGTKLKTVFGYDLPADKIGEYWAISAHPHGVSTVKNGQYQGQKLDELWANHRELFGNVSGEVFPLLTKILDAEDYLSVQVHPNDAYALKHEGELGKSECWYIIDAKPNAKIIYGHHARTRKEFVEMIHDARWNDLLTHVSVKKGEFYYVPSGTIHAIGKGILILETQQSSDTTYRVYDFDRKDDKGNLRKLHIKQSIDVTNIPGVTPKLEIMKEKVGLSMITTFAKTPFFNVYKWRVKGELFLQKGAPYTLVSVIEGKGSLIITESSYALRKGDHFILPAGIDDWHFTGDLTLIASEPGEN
ncbi:MAG: mannose-6-phosphate isomerase, class I [Streptococcaceae bacterium]|jgi:mannose-6-phosphate isomerase|nr:mannose-6-phosphate isomerase, class I [Streptococcaceae bacterium]